MGNGFKSGYAGYFFSTTKTAASVDQTWLRQQRFLRTTNLANHTNARWKTNDEGDRGQDQSFFRLLAF
jgi:hypothetical protein